MACSPMYRSGNRVHDFMCGPGMKSKRTGTCACGEPAFLLCDGPRLGRATCSVPICSDCAVSLRAHDLDICPSCAIAVPTDGCLLRSLGPTRSEAAACHGVLMDRLGLCVRHAVLFDHWHAFEGGEAIYCDAALNKEQRREEHRRWLRSADGDALQAILEERHAPPIATAPPKDPPAR